MKIFFCDNRLGGLLGFRIDVIRHFIALGHEVCLVVPPALSEWDKIGMDNVSGCRIIEVDMQPSGLNPIKDLKLFRQYLSIYRRERPDIVFNYTIKPNIYSSIAAKMCGSRVFCMVAGLGYIFDANALVKHVGLFLYKMGIDRAERVLVLNQMNYDKLQSSKMASADKLLLLEGGEGVNLNDYPQAPADYSSNVTFLMVSRVLYDKGYAEFVEAARAVKAVHPEVRFEILGPLAYDSPMGVPRKVFEKDLGEGIFEYLGVSNDAKSVVGKPNTVIVLPSYHEGMSRSLMEACAIGRPIITSAIPGCQETVDAGQNGYLVPKGDSTALAEAMTRFILLPEAEKIKMAEASHEIALRRFDITHVIQIYDSLLTK